MAEWAKRTRKWHRWIAIPMFILVPITAVLRMSGNGQILKDIPAVEAVQSILMLLMVLTGAYLYTFRVVNRKKRARRTAVAADAGSKSPV